MPRKLAFDRDAAIETAMNEIWQVGYEAASVKHLAETLGITRSSFYNAFGSREALFDLVVDRYLQRTALATLYEATPETPLKPLITRSIKNLTRNASRDKARRGCLIANCTSEMLPCNGKPGQSLVKLTQDAIKFYQQLMLWAIDRNELPEDSDVEGLAMALHSLTIGINTQSKVIHNEKALWRSASTTLRGLGLYEDNE